MQEAGELLSVQQAIRLTGLSRFFLLKLDESGEVRAIRIGTGKHRRFRRTDLMKYMKGKTSER